MTASTDGLFGTWKLISNLIRMQDTGEEFDLFGVNPRGVITFAPNGRMTVIITTADRPSPVSDADCRAIVMGMCAYSGPFTIHDDYVVIDADVAWLPYPRQIRYFELDGDRLTLRTPVQELPIRPGRLLRNTIVWQRETQTRSPPPVWGNIAATRVHRHQRSRAAAASASSQYPIRMPAFICAPSA